MGARREVPVPHLPLRGGALRLRARRWLDAHAFRWHALSLHERPPRRMGAVRGNHNRYRCVRRVCFICAGSPLPRARLPRQHDRVGTYRRGDNGHLHRRRSRHADGMANNPRLGVQERDRRPLRPRRGRSVPQRERLKGDRLRADRARDADRRPRSLRGRDIHDSGDASRFASSRGDWSSRRELAVPHLSPP